MNAPKWTIPAIAALAMSLTAQTPQTGPAEPGQAAAIELRRTLLSAWRESISAPRDGNAPDLADASQKLRELMLPTTRPAAETQPARPAAQAAAPVRPVPVAAATTQPAAAPAAAPAELTQADIDRLKTMELERLSDACGLADTLFQAGQYEAALTIYGRLKDHSPAGAANAPRSGAAPDWVIFQAANCTARLGRHAEAVDLYGQLLAKHPNSAWAGVAKVQGAIQQWHQQEKPADLLGQAAEVSRPATTQPAEAVAARPKSKPTEPK
jgi:tetratricopeptide (TPR) repeat protein